MGTIISVCNQKGGCGKTTTVVNTAHALARMDYRVLVIDLDPQSNSTFILGNMKLLTQQRTIVTFFEEDNATIESCIYPSKYKNLDLLASEIELFATKLKVATDAVTWLKLKQKMPQSLKDNYDYILIDTPPDLGGFLVTNALVASHYYIVPIGAEDYFALEGFDQMVDQIKRIQEGLNPDLRMLGALITMRDNRSKVSKAMVKAIPNAFGKENVFETTIRRNAGLGAAASKQKTIYDYDLRQHGVKDHYDLSQEIVNRING